MPESDAESGLCHLVRALGTVGVSAPVPTSSHPSSLNAWRQPQPLAICRRRSLSVCDVPPRVTTGSAYAPDPPAPTTPRGGHIKRRRPVTWDGSDADRRVTCPANAGSGNLRRCEIGDVMSELVLLRKYYLPSPGTHTMKKLLILWPYSLPRFQKNDEYFQDA